MLERLGSRPVTLREVAAVAGVSVATASRALNGGHHVADAIVARVNLAATRIGYQPNIGARGLRTRRTMTLGFVTAGLTLPVLDFLDGFYARAEGAGYSVFLANARGNPAQYRVLVRRLFERRVDGLLVAAPRELDDSATPYLIGQRPVLAVFGRSELAASIPLVTSSELGALREAMAHLVALGHRSVAFIDIDAESFRPSHIVTAANEVGMHCRILRKPVGVLIDSIEEDLREVTTGDQPATAIAINVGLAGPLLRALRSLAWRIPGDISVLAFSDSRISDILIEPPLSSIHTDLLAMGEQTAGILIQWVESNVPPANVTDLALTSWAETGSIGAVSRVSSRGE